MSFPSRNVSIALTALVVVCAFASVTALPSVATAQTTRPGTLVVVSDPNNLPFSNAKEEGFENKLAQLIARDLDCKLEYHWRALRRGYWREAIKSAEADLVMGVPRNLGMALTTEPYYRSTYVFVTRNTPPASLDDPQLKRLRIGIPLTGDNNPPPAIALARRGIIDNVEGFTVYGDYAQPDPPGRLIAAVADKQIDLAIAWGPPAGYFAKRHNLTVTPVMPQSDGALPMAFDVSLGVAKTNTTLRDQLNTVLGNRRAEIDKILDGYNVPRVAAPPAATGSPKLERFDPDKEVKDKTEVPGCCD
jgi:mxaJ protein